MSRLDGDPRPRPPLQRLVAVPSGVGPPSTPLVDVVGSGLEGAPVRVPVATASDRVLLLFLTSGCDGCAPFWPAVEAPHRLGLSSEERAVVVVRDQADEDMEALRRLAGSAAPVVCAGQAWRSYRVQGAPFFVLADPRAGRVVTEGVAWAVEQVAADVARVPPEEGPDGREEEG